jgi:hypothetical protein
MDDKAVDGKKVLVDGILVLNCQDCPHLSRGFLSEPNECGYFKEAYKWFVPRSGIPAWCPMPDKDRAKAK